MFWFVFMLTEICNKGFIFVTKKGPLKIYLPGYLTFAKYISPDGWMELHSTLLLLTIGESQYSLPISSCWCVSL